MGKTKGPYKAEFPEGSLVRIADLNVLCRFKTEWRLHDPISEVQISFHGQEATVRHVGFYFGGDELYALEGVPGVWHEQCLESVQPLG